VQRITRETTDRGLLDRRTCESTCRTIQRTVAINVIDTIILHVKAYIQAEMIHQTKPSQKAICEDAELQNE